MTTPALLAPLDAGHNEIRNFKVISVGSLPSAATYSGEIVRFSNVMYWSDGTTWNNMTPGSGAPSGAAGGSLAGTYPNPTIAASAITATEILNATITLAKMAASATDQAAGTASLRTLGTGAAQAAPGNDSRITGAEQTANKNAASGYAGVDSGSRIAAAQLPAVITAAGITGAVAASRYAGATASGAPASGTFLLGDFIVDQTGKIWICTTAGSPGTWTNVVTFGTASGTVAQGNDSRITGAEQVANKAAASGYASLDGSTKVPIAQLPTGTSSTTVAIGNDSRITGAEQTANKNAASGYAGLSAGSLIAIAQIPTGTSGTTVPFGNDARFTDTRVPTDASVTGGTAGAGVKIAALTITDANISATAAIANTKLATNPLARANHTGTQLASTVSDFDTQVRTSRLDQMAAPTASVSMNSQKITNLLTPTTGTDAATKAYADGLRQGLSVKDPVRVATTANGTLATAYENGDTVDGVTLATNDRILLKNQTTASENGIYFVNASGAPTRDVDADASGEIVVGTAVWVQAGTANGGSRWVATATGATPWVPNSSTSTWTLDFAATATTAGAGLTATGSVLAVGQGTGIIVNANDVAIDTSTVARHFAANVGNASLTSIAVSHNLGTRDVTVEVYDASTFAEVICDVVHTDTNTVTLGFTVAPGTNAYRCVVVG